jgi:hypothetical protein
MRWRLWTLTVSFALLACGESLPPPEQVKKELESQLRPGDSHAAIEKVLKERNLPFSYDKYANRYQSIIRQSDSNFKAVVIYVNVDAEKRFVSVAA